MDPRGAWSPLRHPTLMWRRAAVRKARKGQGRPSGEVCPAASVLRDFLLGLLTPAAITRVGAHLEGCRTCLDSLGRLTAEDSLTEVVKKTCTTTGDLPKAAIARLIRKIRSSTAP